MHLDPRFEFMDVIQTRAGSWESGCEMADSRENWIRYDCAFRTSGLT